tara:strand:- start:162 stop:836 length:675 start_codon:yes stop_codon:yes gene_type:complete
MNANQLVNTPKKSNNIAIIIGVTVLVCCLFSLYLTFMRSRDEGKGLEEIERIEEEKPPSPGPIIRDMTVTTRDTTRIDGEHAISAELLAKMKKAKELNPDMQFNNPLKIDIYDDCDCTQLRQRIQAKDAASGEVNIASIGEEVHPRCVKAEGSVYMDDYKHMAKGKDDDGEPWEHKMDMPELIMGDKPNGMPNVFKLKLGCEENQKNVEDSALKFKWWNISKSA